jgi:ABC-2 type transport system permease protein
MATTDFRLSFHGTVFGYLWSLARPLLTFGVLLAVFTQVFRFGGSVKDYPALLLFNIMLFGLFAEATGGSVTSLAAREGIVRRTQFPRLVVPLSVVLTAVFNLGVNLIAVFIFLLAYGVQPQWGWVLLPVLILAMLGITAGTAMILSGLHPRFRDVALIWGVMQTLLFYATPVLYTITVAPHTIRTIIQMNPLTPIFEQAQKWMIDPNAPGAHGATQGSEYLLVISAAIYIAVCVCGVWVFKREAPRVAEDL